MTLSRPSGEVYLKVCVPAEYCWRLSETVRGKDVPSASGLAGDWQTMVPDELSGWPRESRSPNAQTTSQFTSAVPPP